jgi:hypothetical protein
MAYIVFACTDDIGAWALGIGFKKNILGSMALLNAEGALFMYLQRHM